MVQRFPNPSILSVVSSTSKSDSQSQKSSRRKNTNQLQPQLPLRKKGNVAKFPLPGDERTSLRPVPPKKKTVVPRVSKPEIPKFQSHRARRSRREELARLRKLAEQQPTSSVQPRKRPEKAQSFISELLPSKKSLVTSPNYFRSPSLLLYITRMLILGVGIAVIMGTVLSILKPGSNYSLVSRAADNKGQINTEWKSPPIVPLVVQQTREITALKTELDTIITKFPSLTPGVFLIDTDTGAYVDINGDATMAAASTIKLPILVAFFQAVDQGRIKLNDLLTMKESHVAEGSGNMQFRNPGSKYTALQTVRKMIIISDNTATNMLIEELGGAEILNQSFQSWGLKNTVINNSLPDLSGTNTTTSKDLINLISQINQGGLVSLKSRDRLFRIMERTQNNSLLPRGVGRGSVVAHKTGNLKSMLADVGMIDLVNGRRYLLAVLVKRPDEDQDAVDLIRRVSKETYKYLKSSQ
ncbi:beta-lactamase [Trichodesmium erythraeum IMS101]|uniref:Beta-lactamase n=1 Tax=Trichodesmium erythraeum (strain IMS101) TaxID=203124 RepID=Q10XW0_TRIEI|nr:serine hydrolase [Trichodesmium erythraeum GBRTRLIN201]MDE5092731.1 class A beta-lactamase-related serine hydrolase [Trichodesmium sp. St11_bin5]